MSSNPSLLDDLFDDNAKSPKGAVVTTTKDDDYEETAERILASRDLGNRWIPHGECYFYHDLKNNHNKSRFFKEFIKSLPI